MTSTIHSLSMRHPRESAASSEGTDPTLYDFVFEDDSTRPFPWFIDARSNQTWTGAEVKERTDALALGLQAELSLGLNDNPSYSPRGDVREVVSLITPNDIDFGVVVWALHRIGCTVAPSNISSTAQELQHQLQLSRASAIVVHPSALERTIEAAQSCNIPNDRIILLSRTALPGTISTESLIELGKTLSPENLTERPCSDSITLPRVAFLCFSSGTTGLPKAVIVPHRAVIANILQVRGSAIPRTRAAPGIDRALGLVPFSHMYGLLLLVHVCPLIGVGTVAYSSLPHPFSSFLDSLDERHINHLFLAPPLVSAFVKNPSSQGRAFDRHFKSATVAAAPLDAATEDAFRQMCGSSFLFSQVFGMTETAGLVTALAEGEVPRSGSVGQLVSRCEAKIVGENGEVDRLLSGVTTTHNSVLRGELFVRGPQLCLGYLDNEDATSHTFDEEGFLRTGDMVEVNSEGYIYVVDRLKHIIKCKGYQVSPAELEGYIRQSEYVQDVGVIGRPDPRTGEAPVAFVVLSDKGKEFSASTGQAVESIIKKHVQQLLSEYKWLSDVFVIEAIPKLPSGKILVRELRKLLPTPPAHQVDTSISLVSLSSSASESQETEKLPSLSSITHPKNILPKTLDFAPRDNVPNPGASEKRSQGTSPPTFLDRVQEWLSLYRVFHAIVLCTNLVGVGFSLSHRWPLGNRYAATFALGNILVSLFPRNEIFLRFLYWFSLLLFKRWSPLWVREIIATVLLHLGGLHSGFAISGTIWLIVAVVNFFRAPMHVVVKALSVITCAAITLVCGSAWPGLRNTHHNIFENIHRLAGWFGLIMVWVVVIQGESWEALSNSFNPSKLATKPDIYLAAMLTVMVALPWTTLRKVPVDSHVLSPSVIQLRFHGRGYGVGLFGRVSRHPLRENHAFGISSRGPRAAEHYMLVVGQGDFTRDLIARPPTHLYTRMVKFVGLPYMVNMYRSGLYVVTGAAIGVALSVFLQPDPKSRWHLLWIASRIEETYSTTALADLRDVFARQSPDRIFHQEDFESRVTLWDTRQRGRPELMPLIETHVKAKDVEVVFVTSNPQGTEEILRGCRERRIPAHGPIWDS